MKKITVTMLIIITIVLCLIISIPFVNDLFAVKVKDELLEIPLPENTEVIESVSKAGNLVGNGNGMQYLGALLLKSELGQEELSDYYTEQNGSVVVKQQISQKIECIEHGTLSFESSVTEEDNYFIVYMWGSGISPFSELDLRGH